MDQLELEPVARASDPDTSWEAARSVSSLREKQAAVLRCIRDYTSTHNGICDRELVAYYRFMQPDVRQSESGIRTRRSELVALGLVEDSGERVRLPSGRSAIVWRTT